jgi:hypothetical protein
VRAVKRDHDLIEGNVDVGRDVDEVAEDAARLRIRGASRRQAAGSLVSRIVGSSCPSSAGMPARRVFSARGKRSERPASLAEDDVLVYTPIPLLSV